MFEIIGIVFLSFAAALLWALLLMKSKITVSNISAAFLFSFCALMTASCIQALFVQRIENFLKTLSISVNILFQSFIYTSLIEETVKLFFFGIFVKKIFYNSSLNEKAQHTKNDISSLIMLSVFSGIVFASFENAAYGIIKFNSLIPRNFTALFLHASISTYYVKLHSAHKRINPIALFFMPVILHGSYNMFLHIGGSFVFFAFAVLLFTIVQAYLYWITTSKEKTK